MNWYNLGEIINSMIMLIGKVLYSFVNATIHLFGIPTSEYGFVKFVMSNNLLLYNNKTVTAIILIIVPLIVSFIIKFFDNISSKNKMMVSIILYLLMVYVISMINIWILLTIIAMLLFCIFINMYVKYKKR